MGRKRGGGEVREVGGKGRGKRDYPMMTVTERDRILIEEAQRGDGRFQKLPTKLINCCLPSHVYVTNLAHQTSSMIHAYVHGISHYYIQ